MEAIEIFWAVQVTPSAIYESFKVALGAKFERKLTHFAILASIDQVLLIHK